VADGVYFNVRLDEERTCVLVLIGATEDGRKELLAVDGYRESTQSWRELLGQLKRLGLSAAPKLAIGDGSLGFWIALQEEYGPVVQSFQQRCWVHKTANILDKMPKSVQGKAKQLIHEMYLAPTRKAALAAYDHSSPVTKANSQKPANAWKKIKKCSLPFTISRPNIGRIYGPLTPSNRPLRQFGCAPIEPRVVVPGSRP
jgi:putative transposase